MIKILLRFMLGVLCFAFINIACATEDCTVDNSPEGCICTEESHPSHCQIQIPENDPWYQGVADWVKDNVSYSSSSAGWTGTWKYFCGNDACVKTFDGEGRERDVFYVGENIIFDISSTGMETTISDALYGWANELLTEDDGWLYKIGWAYHGTYLDNSCHAKLSYWRSQWGNDWYTNWYWVEEAGCNSIGFKGYYGAPGFTQATSYSYAAPGIYWVGAIPLVYHGSGVGFRDVADVRVQSGFKRIVIVDQNGCVYGKCLSESEILYGGYHYAWLVPVISLLLN